VIAAVLFGKGDFLIYVSGSMYFLDVCGSTAGASSLSANGLKRYAAGGAFPLFFKQMYSSLCIGWASSLLGFVSLLLVPLSLVFFRWAPRIRSRRKWAPDRILLASNDKI